MPFQSEKQRRYMHANLPEIANRWERDYADGGIARLPQRLTTDDTVGKQMIQMGTASGNALDNQLVELTDSQKKYIDYEKSNLQQGYKTPKHVFETINNPNLGKFETNTFNPFKGPQEPTTKEEYNNYLKSIGVNKSVSSLTNDQYLNQNNLFASADNVLSDANIVDDIDLGINPTGLSTDVYGMNTPAYETFDKDPNWWLEKTGADMINNPDFPLNKENLQELYETGKEKIGGIWDYAKDKGIQGKDLLMAGLGKAINFPVGILSMLSGPSDNPYQKFQKDMFKGYTDQPNKDPWGKNIRSFKDKYDVTDQWDKFAGSKLGQKYNLAALGALSNVS